MSDVILERQEIESKLKKMAKQIAERNEFEKSICLIGIVRRGAVLADALADHIKEIDGPGTEVGALDITLYGADHNLIAKFPVLNGTKIDFSIDNKTVVLIDDILYTGKTIHTAIDALLKLGSPAEIQLACFIDRGRRTFPISADYTGVKIKGTGLDRVALHVDEVDGSTEVIIEKRKSPAKYLGK